MHRLRTDGGLDRHYASAEQLNPTDQSAIDSLEEAEDTAAGMSVREFAGALDYQAHIIEQYFDPKGVELATIHGAKGRHGHSSSLRGSRQESYLTGGAC